LRGDNSYLIMFIREIRKVDVNVTVDQAGWRERGLSDEVVQTIPDLASGTPTGVRKRELGALTAAEEKIEDWELLLQSVKQAQDGC